MFDVIIFLGIAYLLLLFAFDTLEKALVEEARKSGKLE